MAPEGTPNIKILVISYENSNEFLEVVSSNLSAGFILDELEVRNKGDFPCKKCKGFPLQASLYLRLKFNRKLSY